MTMLDSTVSALRRPYSDFELDEAQLAAAGFLARYSGRTVEAYRHDLRGFFQWAADVGIAVLKATRPHVELYRSKLEERGLAASTIDRRLSTPGASHLRLLPGTVTRALEERHGQADLRGECVP